MQEFIGEILVVGGSIASYYLLGLFVPWLKARPHIRLIIGILLTVILLGMFDAF